MQFTFVAIVAALTASVYGAPTGNTPTFIRRSCDIASEYLVKSRYIYQLIVTDTYLLECAAALGPAAVTCTGAAVKKGTGMSLISDTFGSLTGLPADVSKDASCVASVANSVENTVRPFCCSQ
jgi:hypothetical protein